MSQVGFNNIPTINTAFQTKFRTEVEMLLRQEQSVIVPHLTIEHMMGANQMFWNQIGSVTAVPDDVRHDDTQYQEIAHYRRAIVPRDWKVTLLLDQEDQWRTLAEFKNPFSRAIASALAQRADDTAIEGLLNDNFGGIDGRTRISLPSSQIIPATYNGVPGNATATGFNVAKSSMAAKLLRQAFVSEDAEKICLLNAQQMDYFIQQKEVADQNYNVIRGLYEGKVPGYSGLKFVPTERIPKDADGNDQIIVFAKPFVNFAFLKTVETHVDIMPSKNYAWQIFGRQSMACSRTQERAVVVIKCAP